MKSAIENYAVNSGHFETVCPVFAGFYMELFASKDMARVFGGFPFFPNENGVMTLCTPRWGSEKDMPAGWISAGEDFGDIVHGVLTEPEKYHKKGVEALSDPVSFPEVARCFQSGGSYLAEIFFFHFVFEIQYGKKPRSNDVLICSHWKKDRIRLPPLL